MEKLENINKKKKSVLKPVLSIVILLVLAIGISYAQYRYNFVGQLTNNMSTSNIKLEFLESSNEVINITNALPLTDEEGKREESFDFQVSSEMNASQVIEYEISMEKLQADTGYTFFNDNQIKVYLEDYQGNELLEPTLVSNLTNYKLYTGVQEHSSTNIKVEDSYKLRVWIDESVTNSAKNWDMDTKLQYKFKLNVSSNQKPVVTHTVNVVVNNGLVDQASKAVTENTNVVFTLTPTNPYIEPIVTCTNSQTPTINNTTLTVKKVTDDTTCTVTYTNGTTVLYTDGTFIINELPSDRAANIEEHGAVTNEYAALSNSNAMVYEARTDRPYNGQKDSIKYVEIGQKIKPTSTRRWFDQASNMETGDFTNLDTSEVTTMLAMFQKAGYNSNVTSFTLLGLDRWDISSVIDFSGTFSNIGYNATSFNIGDLSNWDTSKVTTMNTMFGTAGYSAQTFNIGNLSNWNTSQVTNMQYMFNRVGYNATTWSIGNLSNWNTSQVTNMQFMFNCAGYSAQTFNLGNLSNWDISKVTTMQTMFQCAGYSATNWYIGDLSNWNVSNVTDMSYMFNYAGYSAQTFNLGNLSNWDISKVTTMQTMFQKAGYSATTWNIGDLSNWNVSNVTNMSYIFSFAGYSATTFNIGNLSNWDVSKVTTMYQLFSDSGYSATTWYIGNLSNWDVSKVTTMFCMFENAGRNSTTWNIGNLSNWGTSKVTDMSYMFNYAGYNSATFNIGNLSNWDTSSVTNMSCMFANAGHYATTWNSIGTLKVYATNIQDIFNDNPKAKATLNIYSNPTTYTNAFSGAATASGSGITVNYSSTTTNIDNIIATKSSNSNVVKGTLLS